MIRKATQEIADKLTSAKFKFDIMDDETSSRVVCGVNGKYNTYRIQFISLNDDNDVAIRAFDLVKFPQEKLNEMISFANECNARYRFVKFVVNTNDYTLQVEIDLPQKNQDPGDIALEMMVRIMQIMDKIGADMMRRVWA